VAGEVIVSPQLDESKSETYFFILAMFNG
jgi:hypothetical protein